MKALTFQTVKINCDQTKRIRKTGPNLYAQCVFQFGFINFCNVTWPPHVSMWQHCHVLPSTVDYLPQKIAITAIDKYGRCAVHYMVSTCEYGTYENEEILSFFAKCKVPLDSKDSSGKTILDYAKELRLEKLLKGVQKALNMPLTEVRVLQICGHSLLSLILCLLFVSFAITFYTSDVSYPDSPYFMFTYQQ